MKQLQNDELRDDFVADQVRVRIALLVRALREQRGWSQSDLGRVMGKPQPNISRIEDPDYGKLSLKTLFELAIAFKLPLYIDMPEWSDWFRMMSDMSSRNLGRQEFSVERLVALSQAASPINAISTTGQLSSGLNIAAQNMTYSGTITGVTNTGSDFVNQLIKSNLGNLLVSAEPDVSTYLQIAQDQQRNVVYGLQLGSVLPTQFKAA